MLYNGWIKRNSDSFYFNSSTITVNECNDMFNITSLKKPNQVCSLLIVIKLSSCIQIDKKDVDRFSIDSIALRLPLLDYRVQLKASAASVSDLRLDFNGMSNEVTSIVITREELCSSIFYML